MLYTVAAGAVVLIGVLLVGVFRAPVLLLPGFIALGAALIALRFVAGLLIIAQPNEAVVISGRRRRLPDGSVVGYRVVRGGRVLRIPFIERVDRLDLTNIALEIGLKGLYARGGAVVAVKVAANVKISGREPELCNAVERFLGRGRGEVALVARETVEGAIRGIVARLTPDELREDPERVAHEILMEVGDDMSKLGLVLDTLKIVELSDQRRTKG